MTARGKRFRRKGGRKTKAGIILFKKYKLLEKTGTGNHSEVYAAEHIKLHVLRAVKCVNKEKFPYEKLVKEVVYLKSLNHPGIPVIYDVEEDTQYFYIIEEYAEGESLKSMLGRHKKFFPDEIIEYGIQLCEIVSYLHNQKPYPILHSDITPGNIIIKNGKVKLVDFGNSVRITGKEQKTDVYGTLGYTAPEGLQEQSFNVRADIYGICSVLQEMCEEGSKREQTIKERIKTGKLKKIIQKGICEDTDKRYGNVNEVRKKLMELKEHKIRNLTSPEEHKSISITIGCGGITAASGVTTLALHMAKTLRKEGKSALIELGEKRDLGKWKIWQEEHEGYVETIQHGFRYEDIDCYPQADNDIFLYVLNSGYKVIVMDFGNLENSFVNDFKKCNKKILLGNYGVWNYEQSIRKLENIMDGMIIKDWTFATLCSDRKICTILENKLGIRIQKLFSLKNERQYESIASCIFKEEKNTNLFLPANIAASCLKNYK